MIGALSRYAAAEWYKSRDASLKRGRPSVTCSRCYT
jgi:hypothetical protein